MTGNVLVFLKEAIFEGIGRDPGIKQLVLNLGTVNSEDPEGSRSSGTCKFAC